MAKTQPVHLLSIFKISLHNLKQHRVRSALALLGLIVGIAALITTVSIGRGAAEQIRQQILSLGNNFILIKSETFLKEGKIKGVAKEPVPLDTSDYFAIKAEAPHITAMTPVIDKTVDVSYDANRLKAYLKGTNGNIFKIYNRKISSGVPFSNFQVDSGERVAVLGYRTANELFSEKAPLGKTILIQKVPFIVIGVLEELKLQTGIFSDQNLDIFVPYTAVNRLDSERSLDLSYILLIASEKKRHPRIGKVYHPFTAF